MRNKLLPLFLPGIILLLMIGFACSNSEKGNTNTSKDSLQTTKTVQNKRGFNRQRRHQQIRGRKGWKNRGQSVTTKTGSSANLKKLPDVVVLSAAEEEAVKLGTVIATLRPMSDELTAMGKVLANQYRKAIVSYPFPARIAKIYAKVGDHVKKGQKLMVLQSEEVGETTSAFYKAGADFELAKVNFEREKRLFDKGVGAKKNYLTAEAELKVAEANLNAAEKKLHVLGFSENEVRKITKTHQINPVITLYAPIEGKIVKSNLVLGSMVDESTEILTIMDPSILWVDAEIYENDISGIHTGQKVAITVPAYPGETFMGKISYISDLLNETTRTITVRTEVINKDNKLKPGMFASLTISLDHNNNALTIPVSAVLDDKGQKLVFVHSDGKYIPRKVQTGAKNGDYITIISGINEGDVVVTSGNFQLKSKLYEEILRSAGVH